jgi:hypothetical protein
MLHSGAHPKKSVIDEAETAACQTNVAMTMADCFSSSSLMRSG